MSRIVIAPNALKGSLSANDAASAIAAGVRSASPDAEVITVPVADGGDGLLDVMENRPGAVRHAFSVTGPLGKSTTAELVYCEADGIAVIEMAEAAGLALLDPAELDPLNATSRGVGELMLHALELGARHLLVGIGGSATVDGGTGMATALGARLLDADGEVLTGNGQNLSAIHYLDTTTLDPRLQQTTIEVACDVENPLLGETGAARIFGPQKGASEEQVSVLESGLANLSAIFKRDLGKDVADRPGAGAAGGTGAMLLALLTAELREGAALVIEHTGLEAALVGADLLITAEGQLDGQTRHGKAPAAVAALAHRRGIPCFAIGGSLGHGVEKLHDVGIDACFSLCNAPMPLESAMKHAASLLSHTAEQVMRCFLAGQDTGSRPAPG